MHRTTKRLLTQCETNDHLIAIVEYFDLKLHDAEPAGNRMKVYFEPEIEGGKVDCVSLPLELFNEDSYMPNWLNVLRGE